MTLPSKETAHERIFGRKRPPNPPNRHRLIVDNGRERIITNRTRTRWWYIESVGGFMVNFASTTSQRIAQEWQAEITR